MTREFDATPMTPALSPAAAAEWNTYVESVLRGIAHALNNRAAALSAVIELSAEPAEPPDVLRGILGAELGRVRDLVSVVRLLGVPREGEEAFIPSDATAEVRSILELLGEQMDEGGAITIDVKNAAPIRVPRWMFVRALVALAIGVARQSGGKGSTITVAADGDWLVVSADGTGPTADMPLLAAELARAMGGEPLANRYGLRVPTLAALRRREGR